MFVFLKLNDMRHRKVYFNEKSSVLMKNKEIF